MNSDKSIYDSVYVLYAAITSSNSLAIAIDIVADSSWPFKIHEWPMNDEVVLVKFSSF